MRLLILLAIPLVLGSCSGAKMLSKNLSKFDEPLYYLHDTQIKDCDKSTSLAIGSLSGELLDSSTTAKKLKNIILPFLFVNYLENNYTVQLGQNSLTQDYKLFFASSFMDESERTGCYRFIRQSNHPTYVLELNFDTCLTTSVFQQKTTVIFMVIAYSTLYQEVASPAQTSLGVTAQLKRDGNVVFEKKYSIKQTQPYTDKGMNVRSDCVTNMVESLALGTKECIEQIIQDVNRVIGSDE